MAYLDSLSQQEYREALEKVNQARIEHNVKCNTYYWKKKGIRDYQKEYRSYRKQGIPWPKVNPNPINNHREEIIRLRNNGYTLQKIANQFNCTKERIRQIIFGIY